MAKPMKGGMPTKDNCEGMHNGKPVGKMKPKRKKGK